RRLSPERGAATAEAMARLRRRRRARATWFLTGGLARMLGRLRPVPWVRRGAAPGSAGEPASRPASWGTETKPTIAVLPFRNLSGDPEAAFDEFSVADALPPELATPT